MASVIDLWGGSEAKDHACAMDVASGTFGHPVVSQYPE